MSGISWKFFLCDLNTYRPRKSIVFTANGYEIWKHLGDSFQFLPSSSRHPPSLLYNRRPAMPLPLGQFIPSPPTKMFHLIKQASQPSDLKHVTSGTLGNKLCPSVRLGWPVRILASVPERGKQGWNPVWFFISFQGGVQKIGVQGCYCWIHCVAYI